MSVPYLSMFRNGFNATRRSLLTITHLRPLPLPKKDLSSSGSFVCVSCQFRSLHSKQARKGKGAKPETFLGAIKRLEAHVQHIEKAYLDRVRQHEALKVRLPPKHQQLVRALIKVRLWFRNYQTVKSQMSFKTAPTLPSWRPRRPLPLSFLHRLRLSTGFLFLW